MYGRSARRFPKPGSPAPRVFAWTDEWFTGGHTIEDWAFGLVDKDRHKKPSFAEVARAYEGPIPPPLPRTPRVSVVVCAYNAEDTMDACLASLEHLNYPEYEVVVVNDGSKDGTRAITEHYPYARLINQENKGLSVARNVGAEAATGEIVVYTDSDCVADPDWLTYLVGTMERGRLGRLWRPCNFPPPENSLRAGRGRRVARRPVPMSSSTTRSPSTSPAATWAFRRDVLLGLWRVRPDLSRRRRRRRSLLAAAGGCRVRDRVQPGGDGLQYYRRNDWSRAHLGQQRGYGKAEALVYAKHPQSASTASARRCGARAHPMAIWRAFDAARPRTARVHSGVFGRGAVPEPLRAADFADAAFADDLRMGCRVARHCWRSAGVGSPAGWWWVLVPPPLFRDLGDLRRRRVAGQDRSPLFRPPGARAGRASHLARPGAARVRAAQVAVESVARRQPSRAAGGPRPAPSWRERGFVLSYWSEQGEEKEALLGGVMAAAQAQGYAAVMDSGWGVAGPPSRLARVSSIARSPPRRRRTRITVESSGFYRLRCMPVLERIGARRCPDCCWRSTRLPRRRDGRSEPGAVAAIAGAVAACVGVGWQMNRFAGRMRQLVDRSRRRGGADRSRRARPRTAADRRPPYRLIGHHLMLKKLLPHLAAYRWEAEGHLGARPGVPDRRVRADQAVALANRHRRCARRQEDRGAVRRVRGAPAKALLVAACLGVVVAYIGCGGAITSGTTTRRSGASGQSMVNDLRGALLRPSSASRRSPITGGSGSATCSIASPPTASPCRRC